MWWTERVHTMERRHARKTHARALDWPPFQNSSWDNMINVTIWWDEIILDDLSPLKSFWTLLAKWNQRWLKWLTSWSLATVYAPLTSDLNYFHSEQHLWMGDGFKAFELVSEKMLAKFTLLYFAARPSSISGWGENFPGNKIRFGLRLRLLVSCRYLQHFLSKRRLPTIEGSVV